MRCERKRHRPRTAAVVLVELRWLLLFLSVLARNAAGAPLPLAARFLAAGKRSLLLLPLLTMLLLLLLPQEKG